MYLTDGAKTLLFTSVARQPLTITLLLTMPSAKTPQQKSRIVLLDVTLARVTHLCKFVVLCKLLADNTAYSIIVH